MPSYPVKYIFRPTPASTAKSKMSAPSEMQWTLEKFPMELIINIIDLLHPSAHLNFACTSKWFAACSRDALERHRQAKERYMASSDLDPATLLFLLSSAAGFSDPIPAWHVRRFEVWVARMRAEDWRPARVSTDQTQMVYDHSVPPLDWTNPAHNELLDYVKKRGLDADNRLPLWPQPGGSANDTVGLDAALKAILICNCERLNDLKFVANPGSRDRPNVEALCCHIEACQRAESWSPGLLALRKVCVDVNISGWDNAVYAPYDCSIFHFQDFFSLPNIRQLYFRNLEPPDQNDDISFDPTVDLDNSSSVESVFLDGPRRISVPMARFLIMAPRLLRELVIREVENTDVELILRRLTMINPITRMATNNDNALMNLSLYPRGRFRPVSMNYHTQILKQYTHLRNMSIPRSYFDFRVPQVYTGLAEHMASFFPKKMETIILHHWWMDYAASFLNPGLCHHGEVGEYAVFTGLYWAVFNTDDARIANARRWVEDNCLLILDEIDKGMELIIRNGRHPRLRALFLTELEYPTTYRKMLTPWSRPIFTRTIRAARQANIDVHMAAAKNRPPQRTVSFPRAPEHFDLVSSPSYIPRNIYSNRVSFDPIRGVSVARAEGPHEPVEGECGTRSGPCGKCENCLLVYTEETWSKLLNGGNVSVS